MCCLSSRRIIADTHTILAGKKSAVTPPALELTYRLASTKRATHRTHPERAVTSPMATGQPGIEPTYIGSRSRAWTRWTMHGERLIDGQPEIAAQHRVRATA
jgi:hypothetical protein